MTSEFTLTGPDGYMPDGPIDSDLYTRWSATVRPIPFPDYMAPRSGAPLINVPREALMNMSPQLICHAQRTASQGGLQVISPRQTPFSRTMLRNVGGERQLGDHVVGSIAIEDDVWPTIDDDDMSSLLPDEPLPPMGLDKAMQPKTKTTPLTKANHMLNDPVLACLVKGRAVIDLLRRDDVMGNADGVLQLLAEAWGVPESVLSDLEAYTLGIEGPLLRHAIKSDEVYPTMYAPIHVKRSIAMGASEVTRSLLPDDTAIDWKRARVFCEAVYALAMSIEGHVIAKMNHGIHPADPSAPTNRPGVLAFLPAPASAWTFAPHTFSIFPVVDRKTKAFRGIPADVQAALSKYLADVRPLSYALSDGTLANTKKVSAVAVASPLAETIAEGYRVMVRTVVPGGARGRTAAATVRNLIYDTLNNMPLGARMRIARYLKIANEVVKTHLKLDSVPDGVIDRLATRYVALGEKVRSAVVAEAARRGATAEDWWADILSQAPGHYNHFVEGSHGWARVALWLTFKSPTEKWDKLNSAVQISTLTTSALGSVHAMALPAKKGSTERLLAAARAAVKEITSVYASYYMGVADVAMAVSDEAQARGLVRTAETLKEGAILWTLRARCFRGTNVNGMPHDEPDKSDNHYRISSNPVDLALVPAPYRAFESYKTHAMSSSLISTEIKRILSEKAGHRVSKYFEKMSRPIIPCVHSTATRYLTTPTQLAVDLEKAWRYLVGDIAEIARIYGDNLEPEVVHTAKKAKVAEVVPRTFAAPRVNSPKTDYFSTLASLDYDQVEWVEDELLTLPEDVQELIETGSYVSAAELLNVVINATKEYAAHEDMEMETIR